MPTPGEHKTVQARTLEYAEVIGWTRVPREEAERRRGFDPDDPAAERARDRSLFFDDLLSAKVRATRATPMAPGGCACRSSRFPPPPGARTRRTALIGSARSEDSDGQAALGDQRLRSI